MTVPGVRRRALLLLPLVGLAGCASANAEQAPSTSPVPSAPAVTDDSLVVQAQQVTADLGALAKATGRRQRTLRGEMAALAAVHAADAELFIALPPVQPAPVHVPRRAPLAAAAAWRAEQAAAQTLSGLAQQASQGSLASYLAAMSAGIWQQVAGHDPKAVPSPSGVAAPVADSTALQHTLAAEHWATYVYAALGARVPTSVQPLYEQALDVHRGRRDALEAVLTAAGTTPVAAAPAYPIDVTAAQIEPRMAAEYLALIAATTPAARNFAVDALLDSAVRGLDFGTRPTPLPGVAATA